MSGTDNPPVDVGTRPKQNESSPKQLSLRALFLMMRLSGYPFRQSDLYGRETQSRMKEKPRPLPSTTRAKSDVFSVEEVVLGSSVTKLKHLVANGTHSTDTGTHSTDTGTLSTDTGTHSVTSATHSMDIRTHPVDNGMRSTADIGHHVANGTHFIDTGTHPFAKGSNFVANETPPSNGAQSVASGTHSAATGNCVAKETRLVPAIKVQAINGKEHADIHPMAPTDAAFDFYSNTSLHDRIKKAFNILKTHGAFVAMVIVFTLNVVRYLPVIIKQAELNTTSVTMTTYTLVWAQTLYVYLGTARHLGSKLRHFSSAVRNYERMFGYSFDTDVVNSHIRLIIGLIFMSYVILIAGYFIPVIIIFPESRQQLTPFENAQGVYYAIGGTALCVVYLLSAGTLVGPVFALSLLTVIAKKEFMHIGAMTKDVFDQTHEDDTVNSLHAVDREDDSSSICLTGMTTSSHYHRNTETTRTCSPSTVTNGHNLDPVTDTLDANFDLISRRHEAVCSLVDRCQDLLGHVIPATYGFGMVSVCFVVFSLASGSLPRGDLSMLGYVLAVHVLSVVFVTLLGFSLHYAAKAILAPIFAANKANLSASLLQKMQFVVTRLTAEEVGYHVYGLFVVSRPTILMLGGTVLTYTVVVVQFQMGSCTCSPCPANVSLV